MLGKKLGFSARRWARRDGCWVRAALLRLLEDAAERARDDDELARFLLLDVDFLERDCARVL